MIRATFDTARFLADIEAVRVAREVTWDRIFRETACAYAYISRPARANIKRISVDTMAVMATWAGLDVSDYICVESPRAQEEVSA